MARESIANTEEAGNTVNVSFLQTFLLFLLTFASYYTSPPPEQPIPDAGTHQIFVSPIHSTKSPEFSDNALAAPMANGNGIFFFPYMDGTDCQSYISVYVHLPSGFDPSNPDTLLDPVLSEDGCSLNIRLHWTEYFLDHHILLHHKHAWMKEGANYALDRNSKMAGLCSAQEVIKNTSTTLQLIPYSNVSVDLPNKCSEVVDDTSISTMPAVRKNGRVFEVMVAHVRLRVEAQKVKKSTSVQISFFDDWDDKNEDESPSSKKIRTQK